MQPSITHAKKRNKRKRSEPGPREETFRLDLLLAACKKQAAEQPSFGQRVEAIVPDLPQSSNQTLSEIASPSSFWQQPHASAWAKIDKLQEFLSTISSLEVRNFVGATALGIIVKDACASLDELPKNTY